MSHKVAILVSDNLLPGSTDTREDVFELTEQIAKLKPAFAATGMELDLVRWREAGEKAKDYEAMLPLFVWDYFENNEATFLGQITEASQHTKVLNPPEVLKWNSDKSYLDEMAKSGAPVIQTLYLERVSEAGISAAFDTLNTDTLVIKPQVGGGAWRQVLYKKGDPFPGADELPPENAMVQAFLHSVKEEGEYSFLYFDRRFSHGLVKKAKKGDYRIQSIYGGTEETYTPTDQELETAKRILASLGFVPLYARVDLLRGNDGQLKLIELELIEPYLYLPHSGGENGDNKGAQRLAATLMARLGD